MFVLTPVTKEANETSLHDSTTEEGAKLFFDEAGDPGFWGIGDLKALDQLVEVGLDQLIEQSITRLARLIVADGFRALAWS